MSNQVRKMLFIFFWVKGVTVSNCNSTNSTQIPSDELTFFPTTWLALNGGTLLSPCS